MVDWPTSKATAPKEGAANVGEILEPLSQRSVSNSVYIGRSVLQELALPNRQVDLIPENTRPLH